MFKRRKILVVDDDRLTREIMIRTLSKAGYEVITASDGLTAVEIAETEKPDLVLTDGLLPKMHGFLVCEAIKAFEAPPKVVVITGVYTKPTYKWEVKSQYGADEILLKPVAPSVLLEMVEKQLRGLPFATVSEEAYALPEYAETA
ncbi:MAG: response regulator [Blastocatellia bacterium]|nr:response regulator [Blastocatellia bacterium]